MVTTFDRKEFEPSPFLSAGRHCPPRPSTPYLTEKILTLVSSGDRNGGDGDCHQRGSLPPPVSPTDSVAQAMKNDLEQLIGYIDNLAFEQKVDEKVFATKTRTPSTNKELFPSDNNPSNINYDEPSKNLNVFRDRTNKFMTNVGENNLLGKLRDPKVATVASPPNLTATTKAPANYHQSSVNSIYQQGSLIDEEPKMIDPAGNSPRRQEPAGSPPSQEASLYFHDESLSLNLSQSQDVDDSNINGDYLNTKVSMTGQDIVGLRRPLRLLSTLQKNGLISSPERSKTISFLHVSKDPTPLKGMRSTSSFNDDEHHVATPAGQFRVNFNTSDDDESGLHSTSELRLKNFESRQATPFPRVLDRFDRENVDRKGHEWWRVRSIPRDVSTRGDVSFHVNSNGNSSSNENKDAKSLKQVESVTTPLRKPQYAPKGTPYPSSRTDDGKKIDIGDSMLETPVLQQGQQSNLVLTSPESAKKLLRSAIEALQDARKERDEARQWANDIKKSVNEWVEDQRRLIRTESASISDNSNRASATVVEQQQQAIEDLINDLGSQIKISKSDTETQVHTMMVKQDEQIRELSLQLTSVKEQVSRFMKEDTSKIGPSSSASVLDKHQKMIDKSSRLNNGDAPGLAHRTPSNETSGLTRSASRSETSHASSRGSRTRRSTPGGGHLIDFGNGVTKELHPDGTTVTRFRNGDVETRFSPNSPASPSPSASCMVAYYHSKEEVLQITQRDGSVLYEYANGQVERHCADGVKIILFPDGTKTIV